MGETDWLPATGRGDILAVASTRLAGNHRLLRVALYADTNGASTERLVTHNGTVSRHAYAQRHQRPSLTGTISSQAVQLVTVPMVARHYYEIFSYKSRHVHHDEENMMNVNLI